MLGLWPWSFCSCKANNLENFCLWSCSKVVSKCSAMVAGSIRLVVSHPIFCLFINALIISGDNLFANRAAKSRLSDSFIWDRNAIGGGLPSVP